MLVVSLAERNTRKCERWWKIIFEMILECYMMRTWMAA
jgi:hypothetical protein